MTCSIKLARSFAAIAALVLLVGSQGQAGFTLAELSITPATPEVFGGTTITFTPLTPQTFTASSGVNLINVAASSITTTGTGDTGSFAFNEQFSLTGTGVNTGQNEVATLSGTFNLTQGLMGAIISNVAFATVAVNSGSGYSFSNLAYAQPTPGSSANGGMANSGNISLTISTAAVPEPASVAMLGLGLVGLVSVAARRRAAK